MRLLASKRFRSNLILTALWLTIAVLLVLVREVLLPFLLAIFLAYLLQPLVRRLRQFTVRGRSIPPALATLALYILFFTLVVVLGRVTFPQVAREVVKLGRISTEAVIRLRQDAPTWPDRVEVVLNRYSIPVHFVWGTKGLPSSVPSEPIALPEVDAVTGQLTGEPRAALLAVDLKKELSGYVAEVTDLVSQGVALVVTQAQGLVRNLFGFVFKTFLVLMMCAFILADTERISRFAFSIIPISDREAFDNLLARIDRGLSGVVRGQVIICLINGLLTLVGMLVLGVPLAFLLAGLATLLSLIPIFGSIISTVPIVAIALTQSFSLALLALLWIVGIHLLESNLLNPKIMGDAAKIHPVLVVLALLVGEHFYGLIGALFAVPIASILLTLFKFLQQRALALQDEAVEQPEGSVPLAALAPSPSLDPPSTS
ncbi:MAG: AI-2E family transporter [Pseudomonadota bacterium]